MLAHGVSSNHSSKNRHLSHSNENETRTKKFRTNEEFTKSNSTLQNNNETKKQKDTFNHVDISEEHLFTIQQLKDNILDLTRTIQQKDKLLQEKDLKVLFVCFFF